MSTVANAPSAKTAVVKVFASTVANAPSAKTAVVKEFVSTVANATSAKTAVVTGFVSTVANATSAKTAVVNVSTKTKDVRSSRTKMLLGSCPRTYMAMILNSAWELDLPAATASRAVTEHFKGTYVLVFPSMTVYIDPIRCAL